MTDEARELAETCGGYWSAHPDHPFDVWQCEVSNNDTREGYWTWVVSRIKEEKYS